VDDVQLLGRNVRRIRSERQLSLGALARESGLAKQTLANLESGHGNPTVETLFAVARALGIAVTWLVSEWGSPVFLQRHHEAPWDDTPGARRRALDLTYGTGHVATAVLHLTTDRTTTPALAPGTLHHVYVMSGTVLAGTAEDPQTLTAGDFIRFPGDLPHLLRASADAARVHVVTTVPQVQQFASR